jgi:uncharacterized membrane protein
MEASMRTLLAGQISIVTGTLALAGTMWAGGSGDAAALAGRVLAALSAAGSAQAAGLGAQDGAGGNAAPGTASAVANPAATEDGKAGHVHKDVYSVINLASIPGSITDVNARGQAVFEYYSLEDDLVNVGFFDGERTINISPPGHRNALLGALNDKGEVAFYARLQVPGKPGETSFQPFRWSPWRGLQPLQSLDIEENTFARDINKRGDIIGYSRSTAGTIAYQAVRWSADNRLFPLPRPAGTVETYSSDINDSAVSAGYGSLAAGGAHAVVWDAAGRARDPGNFGENSAVAGRINNRGELAGIIDTNGPRISAFLLSPGKPLLRVGTGTGVEALNNAGELVGRRRLADSSTHAYLFSRARGLVDLHPASFRSSEAAALNDSGVAVGLVRPGRVTSSLAYRWSRGGAVDLNTRLLDAPAGLVLTEALAISANGDIVADSNAGLLLLRPGKRGTDAPVLGPMTFSTLQGGQLSRLSLPFRDRNLNDTHTATVDWGDGRGPQPAVVRQFRGRGEVQSEHKLPDWGGFRVIVRVTDSSRRTTTLGALVTAEEVGIPELVGSGTLAPGAAQDRPTLFRLAAPLTLQNGATRPFTFQLLGNTTFKGEQLDRVSVEGNRIRLEGRGQLEGRPGYRFTIDASTGEGAASRMAVRITADEANGGARLAFAAGDGVENGQAALAAELRRGSLRLLKPAASQR